MADKPPAAHARNRGLEIGLVSQLHEDYDDMLRCPTCNHCLRGATTDPVRCSECGSEFPMSTLEHFAYGDDIPLGRAIRDSMIWCGGFALLLATGLVLPWHETSSILLVATAVVGGLLSLRRFSRVTTGIEGRWPMLLHTVISIIGFFALILAVVWGGRRGVAPLETGLGLPHALSVTIVTIIGIVIVLWCTLIGLKAWSKHLEAFFCTCLQHSAEGGSDEGAPEGGGESGRSGP